MVSEKKDSNKRYERKCRVENTNRHQVWHLIKHHPAFFKAIYQPRQINNIYFDSLQFKYYKANEIGIANRKKVRIRWYGPIANIAKQPQLEIKIKNGLVGDKLVYPLPAFSLTNKFTPQFFVDLAATYQVPKTILEELRSLRPTLFNTYQRSYFQSVDKNFRLTFDEDMMFYRPNFLSNQQLKGKQTIGSFIIELKYQLAHDPLARKIFQQFPYRLTKNSKYVNGIDLLQLN